MKILNTKRKINKEKMSHTGSTSALASLTATYTDSEGEEENEGNSLQEGESGSGKSPLGSTNDASEGSDRGSDRPISTPISPVGFTSVTIATKMTTLVSYHDDTIASDDGEGDEDIPQEIIVLNENDIQIEDMETTEEDGVIIPPEPPGKCSADLQDKIVKLYKKMETQNMDMNAAIQKRKDFRNPSIYEKLVQYCGLNELGTNYPPSMYDPLKWDKASYYEELAKVQKTEMDRREKERKGKAEAVTKKVEEEVAANKRKSKWDMPAAGNAGSKASVAPPTLTTTVTGTKSTVISAFGSLPKKVKP